MPESEPDLPPLRRRPKLAPDAPPPLEPAPSPKPVFRFRTDFPEPTDKPSKDNLRDVFFITWKSQNPAGKMGDEDFERAYGDFQAQQYEAKNFYRLGPPPSQPRFARVVIIVVVIGVACFTLVRVFGSKPRVTTPAPPPAANPSPRSAR